jgi:hypothetical protein
MSALFDALLEKFYEFAFGAHCCEKCGELLDGQQLHPTNCCFKGQTSDLLSVAGLQHAFLGAHSVREVPMYSGLRLRIGGTESLCRLCDFGAAIDYATLRRMVRDKARLCQEVRERNKK